MNDSEKGLLVIIAVFALSMLILQSVLWGFVLGVFINIVLILVGNANAQNEKKKF